MSENVQVEKEYSGKYPWYKRYAFEPYKGIHIPKKGFLLFGMTEEEVDRILAGEVKNSWGDYPELGISPAFDRIRGLMSINVSSDCATLMLFNQAISEAPFIQIVNGVINQGGEYYIEGKVEDPTSIASLEFGFACSVNSQADYENILTDPTEAIELFPEWEKDNFRDKKDTGAKGGLS